MATPRNVWTGIFAGLLISGALGAWTYAAAYAASSQPEAATRAQAHPAAPAPPQAMSSSQVQGLYAAISSVPTTPAAFVNAYMHALRTGSGLYARAYLSYSILRQIPPSVGHARSGQAPWITKWNIVFDGHSWKVTKLRFGSHSTRVYNADNTFTVTAFGPLAPHGDQGVVGPLFRDKLSVLSTNVASPANDTPPYTIDAQTVTWLHSGVKPRRGTVIFP